MTNQEMLRILKSTNDEKKLLYETFCEKVAHGEILQDAEIVIFETLRKELTIKPKVRMDMSASLIGDGGVSG